MSYHTVPRSPLGGPPSCSALQRTSSPQPPVTPPIGRCCSTPKVSLNSGSPPVLVHGPCCDEAFATRHSVGASKNTLPAGSAAAVQDLRELVSREARERTYSQLAVSNKLREQQDMAANLQALLNSNFSELRKELEELRATVAEKLGSHGSSRVGNAQATGKDALSSTLESTQEQLLVNARLQCTEVGLQEVRDALQSLKQREDLRLRQDEVALRRLQDGLDGLSSGTDMRALVKCTDEDSEQPDPLLNSWPGLRRFSSCSSSVLRDVDKESFEGDIPVGRSLDRRLQELRSENLQQMEDLEKQVKDELASLRGWVDAAIVAVINRLGLLERGHQTSASARGSELKLPELRQSTECSRQPLLENCKAGRGTSASSTATCTSSLVTRSSCDGRSFSSGRQQSMGPGTDISDIPAPVNSEGSGMVVAATPLTGSPSFQGLARSSQSQSSLSGQASAGMPLPQSVITLRPGCTQMAPTMPVVLTTCTASNVCGGASMRVRSCGPPNTARASFGIPSKATTTTVPGNGVGTPRVGGNVATNQARTN